MTNEENKVADRIGKLVSDLTLDIEQVGLYIGRQPNVILNRLEIITETARPTLARCVLGNGVCTMSNEVEELEQDSEFLTAGLVAEYLSQEFDEDETVSYNIYSKSDVESDLGVEITEEQWLKFLRLWENDDVLNETRAAVWMETVDTLRQELGIEEE